MEVDNGSPPIVVTLPETNIAPENRCSWNMLEWYFPIGEAYFQGRTVSFREGTFQLQPFSTIIMGERVHSNQPRSSLSILPYLAIYFRKLVVDLNPKKKMFVKLEIISPQIGVKTNKSLSCYHLREKKITFLATNTFPPPPHLQNEQTPTRPLWHLFAPFLPRVGRFWGASKGCLVLNINQPSRKSCFSNTLPGFLVWFGLLASNFRIRLEWDVLKKKRRMAILTNCFCFFVVFWNWEIWPSLKVVQQGRLLVKSAILQETVCQTNRTVGQQERH